MIIINNNYHYCYHYHYHNYYHCYYCYYYCYYNYYYHSSRIYQCSIISYNIFIFPSYPCNPCFPPCLRYRFIDIFILPSDPCDPCFPCCLRCRFIDIFFIFLNIFTFPSDPSDPCFPPLLRYTMFNRHVLDRLVNSKMDITDFTDCMDFVQIQESIIY